MTAEIHTEIHVPGITPEQATRTTTAIRHAGARLHAPDSEVRTALAALFDAPVSQTTVAPSKLNEGTPLSPADKTLIRQLLTSGRSTAEITEQVGCSAQAVAGVRVGLAKQHAHQAGA